MGREELRVPWAEWTYRARGFRFPPQFDRLGTDFALVSITGGRYHSNSLRQSAFDPGQRVMILPEPENPIDPEALAVWDSSKAYHCGYIPTSYLDRVRRFEAGGLIQ